MFIEINACLVTFTFRALGCAPRLAELNPYVKVETSNEDLETCDLQFLKQYQVIKFCQMSLAIYMK